MLDDGQRLRHVVLDLARRDAWTYQVVEELCGNRYVLGGDGLLVWRLLPLQLGNALAEARELLSNLGVFGYGFIQPW